MSQEKFMKWLESGSEEMCIIERHSSESGYFRHKLPNGIDIIYVYDNIKDGEIPLYNDPEYQGLYMRETGLFYDIQHSLKRLVSQDRYQGLEHSDLQKEYESRMRERVEKMVSEFESDIKLDDTTQSIQESQKYYADEQARKIYLQNLDADFIYHCEYENCNFKKNLIAYILDSEKVIDENAKIYLADNKNKITEQIVYNLMTKAKVQEFEKGADKYLTSIKNIIKSVPSECKTVNVTTVIDGKELTFKYEASCLRHDCRGSYATWHIPAKDRTQFELLYGRSVHFKPMDITKITYGKKVLYAKEATVNEKEN